MGERHVGLTQLLAALLENVLTSYSWISWPIQQALNLGFGRVLGVMGREKSARNSILRSNRGGLRERFPKQEVESMSHVKT